MPKKVSRKNEFWVVCGREIGSASGWDQWDTFVIQLYNLVPHGAYAGPVSDCVSIDFERGLIETRDDEGVVTGSADLLDAISACPRAAAK